MEDDRDNTLKGTFTISAPRRIAEEVRCIILENRLFDPERSIGRNDTIHFPVLLPEGKEILWMEQLFGQLKDNIEILSSNQGTLPREERLPPFEEIKRRLEGLIGREKLDALPEGWDLIGDCLVLKLPASFEPEIQVIARIYQDVLGARYTLNDLTGIEGELRQPTFQVVTKPPDGNWEVTHVENGVLYTLDPMKVMFSSGNVDERMGIVNVINEGAKPPRTEMEGGKEIILDMFAGIGYFTLPISLKCPLDRIYAVEKNPVSFYYLERNIRDNKVTDLAVPIYGDNRKVGPTQKADRIIMGYVGGTVDFIPRAVELSSPEGSIIHLHDTVKVEDGPDVLFREVESKMEGARMVPILLSHNKVKSYAPRIDHVVLNILLKPD